MRYNVSVGSMRDGAETIDKAVSILCGLVNCDRQAVKQDLLITGDARVSFNSVTGRITDTLFAEAERARDAARRIYAKDGELEFDPGQVVQRHDDGYRVKCWVWVDADSAGIDTLDEDADEESVTAAYLAAAEHSDVEFDETSEASLGADPGAYVSGWVTVSDADVQERYTVLVALACRNSGGEPAFYTTKIEVNKDEFKQDMHIGLAIEEAEDGAYEGPFIPFDTNYAAALKGAAEELEMNAGLTPVDKLDVHGAPEERNYVVKVQRSLQYDDIEVSVRACGIERAQEIAIDQSSGAESHPAGEIITTIVLDAAD